ncbi:hypothetical protein ANCDUO_26306 [Ancylostoma duodenale]|uniref:Uncharacterized protein n=1 Tax=Ancylostoma duodenale TaxID=51022 RepID=A0A0C2BIR3_9BILA|nr:hypothetical protein ANCDUO_26306 [Ancylostoma duodenale]
MGYPMRIIRQTMPRQTTICFGRSHWLSEQRFESFEDVEKWVKEWIESEDEDFYICGVRLRPER